MATLTGSPITPDQLHRDLQAGKHPSKSAFQARCSRRHPLMWLVPTTVGYFVVIPKPDGVDGARFRLQSWSEDSPGLWPSVDDESRTTAGSCKCGVVKDYSIGELKAFVRNGVLEEVVPTSASTTVARRHARS